MVYWRVYKQKPCDWSLPVIFWLNVECSCLGITHYFSTWIASPVPEPVFSSVIQDIWAGLISKLSIILLSNSLDQSHPHLVFLHGANPFRLKDVGGLYWNIWKHWSKTTHLKLIRHNRTRRWSLLPFDSWPLDLTSWKVIAWHSCRAQPVDYCQEKQLLNGKGKGKTTHWLQWIGILFLTEVQLRS